MPAGGLEEAEESAAAPATAALTEAMPLPGSGAMVTGR